MADSYTPNKSLILMQTGGDVGAWGANLNDSVMSILDNNLGGNLTKSVAGSSDVTLSAAQAENLYYNFTGALTGNINVIWPTGAGFYIVTNGTSGSYTLTVKPTGGTGVAITQGATVIVFVSTTTTTAFIAGSSISIPVTVGSGGTGATTLTLNNVVLGNGTSAVQLVAPSTLGNVLASDGTTWASTAGYAQLGVAQAFTKAQRGTPVVLSSSSNSTAIDFSLGNDYSATLSENTTFANPSNIVAGQAGQIAITNGAGPYTVAYGSYFKFPSGTVPAVTATNGATDILVYYVKSSTFIAATLLKGFA